MPAIPPSGAPAAGAQPRPVLQVVRGEPTAAELAAVLVVLGGRASHLHTPDARPRRSAWAAKDRMMRPPVIAGPGAWRASALPG
ncbi:MAG TPA: acyl-CoA carboxylase subunit epsilon [Streptosporangiaceae bacterium]|nr:acyl-CoA carboxylase subunit epsilon [Streptosporangiaceae bacterium]